MKEAITSNKIVTLVVGTLFIVGLAAIFGIYRAAKNSEDLPYYV